MIWTQQSDLFWVIDHTPGFWLFSFRSVDPNSWRPTTKDKSSTHQTHTIHVWYIYLHVIAYYGHGSYGKWIRSPQKKKKHIFGLRHFLRCTPKSTNDALDVFSFIFECMWRYHGWWMAFFLFVVSFCVFLKHWYWCFFLGTPDNVPKDGKIV